MSLLDDQYGPYWDCVQCGFVATPNLTLVQAKAILRTGPGTSVDREGSHHRRRLKGYDH